MVVTASCRCRESRGLVVGTSRQLLTSRVRVQKGSNFTDVIRKQESEGLSILPSSFHTHVNTHTHT